jgi:3-hydroxyacyl-CoA dehydrogenase
MSTYPIKHAAVLGAGVMGAQIAAHFANAQIPTFLLDRVLPEDSSSILKEVRNKLAWQGLERAKKANPLAFFLPEYAHWITLGNFDDDLEKLSEADWILEAVSEDLEIKRSLFQKVEKIRKPNAIVSTNTSGIPISKIAEGFSDDFKAYFLGTHFFNPPRYMRLLEIIPLPETLPEVQKTIVDTAETLLGKGIVFCKDTPGFVANRIAVFGVGIVLKAMQELGLTIEEVDLLTGAAMGRPKTATFRTLDLVGLDTFFHVSENLYKSLSNDPFREFFKPPDFIQTMVEKGCLGEKSGQGFYKKIKSNGKSEILVLDLNTFEYRPRISSKIPSLGMASAAETLQDKLLALARAHDKGGEFFWRTTLGLLAYASSKVHEICDSPKSVDDAMHWGFGWKLGPFELWELLGVEKVAEKMRAQNLNPPEFVLEMIQSGRKQFYDPCANIHPKVISLPCIKSELSKIVAENSGATLLDLGDGILCLEFHSKMNTIGEEILRMGEKALFLLEEKFDGLILGNQGDDFCVGANLMLVLMLAEEEEWEELDLAVRRFQKLNMQIKYASKPIVCAPFGRTLGGGCEMVLHCAKACAHAETYIGLVELGAGLIPAGGGTKEMAGRTLQKCALASSDPLKALQKTFETIALAKVSGSAEEAKRLGYLNPDDPICINRDFLLHISKKTILSMLEQGYRPKIKEKIKAYGKALYSNLLVGIYLMQEANRITEYDAHLAKKLAYVFSGGDFTSIQEVPEEYFLDLEREAFLSLAGEKKTQARMRHLLKEGKPLRN